MLSLPVVLALMLLMFACGAVMAHGFHAIERAARAEHSRRRTAQRGERVLALAETAPETPETGDVVYGWPCGVDPRAETAPLPAVLVVSADKTL